MDIKAWIHYPNLNLHLNLSLNLNFNRDFSNLDQGRLGFQVLDLSFKLKLKFFEFLLKV